MKTKWIKRALLDRDRSQNDLARAIQLDVARTSKVVLERPDAPELTVANAVGLARLLGMNQYDLQDKFGPVATKHAITWPQAAFVTERLCLDLNEVCAKLSDTSPGEEVFVW
jgi:hypothetical protein